MTTPTVTIVELAARSPTLRHMLQQGERAYRAARMLSLTSHTAAVALLQAQAERTTAAAPEIRDELYPALFDRAASVAGRRGKSNDDALRALTRRVERLERADDKSMGRRI